MTPSQAYALATLFGTRWRALDQTIVDTRRLLEQPTEDTNTGRRAHDALHVELRCSEAALHELQEVEHAVRHLLELDAPKSEGDSDAQGH